MCIYIFILIFIYLFIYFLLIYLCMYVCMLYIYIHMCVYIAIYSFIWDCSYDYGYLSQAPEVSWSKLSLTWHRHDLFYQQNDPNRSDGWILNMTNNYQPCPIFWDPFIPQFWALPLWDDWEGGSFIEKDRYRLAKRLYLATFWSSCTVVPPSFKLV